MIEQLKAGKASGIDLITAELLTGLNQSFRVVLTKLFNKMFDHCEFPEEWAIGIIVLLFKGGVSQTLIITEALHFSVFSGNSFWESI